MRCVLLWIGERAVAVWLAISAVVLAGLYVGQMIS